MHTKQSVHVRAPAFASAIIPTHVCDRTYTRVKSGSHASEVLITHVSHAYHLCVTRVSHASVNYIASELYYTIDPDTSMFYLHVKTRYSMCSHNCDHGQDRVHGPNSRVV